MKTNPHRGDRIITEWVFGSGDRAITVYVRHRWNSRRDPVHWFYAYGRRADGNLSGVGDLEDTDINNLYEKVRRIICDEDKYDWKPRLYIEVTGKIDDCDGLVDGESNAFMGWESQLELKITTLQIAKHGREEYHRAGKGQASSGGLPETGDTKPQFGHAQEMKALVEDTPQNRQALKTILDAFAKANAQLQKLMHPDNVQRTLSSVPAQILIDQ